MSKYYGVKKGRKTGVFNSWEECEKQVKGISGADYKSFSSYKDALMYVDSVPTIEEENVLKVYVDGSYFKENKKAGFGCVFVDKDKIIHSISKEVAIDPEENLWNVTAEIEGVLAAMEWAIANKFKTLSIYYDYEGLEKWVNGSWKAKKKTTKRYVASMNSYAKNIKINFFKVKAHTGDTYNEIADDLAKKAIDSSVNEDPKNKYILSYDEYKQIIKDITKENILIKFDEFFLNENIMKKIAKKVWKSNGGLLKDFGDATIEFNIHTRIMLTKIAHKTNGHIEEIYIELEKSR